MEYAILIFVAVTIQTIILWIAMRLTKVEGNILHVFLAAGAATLVSRIPPLFIPQTIFISQILSFVVLVLLLSFWTTAEPWPDAVLIVVVAWVISYLVSLYLLGLLEHIARS